MIELTRRDPRTQAWHGRDNSPMLTQINGDYDKMLWSDVERIDDK